MKNNCGRELCGLSKRILAYLSAMEPGESISADGLAEEVCANLGETYDALDELLNEHLVESISGIGKPNPTYVITKKGKCYRPEEADGTSVPAEPAPEAVRAPAKPAKAPKAHKGRPPGKGRKKAQGEAPKAVEAQEKGLGEWSMSAEIPSFHIAPDAPCPPRAPCGEFETVEGVLAGVGVLLDWVGEGSLSLRAVLPFRGGTVTIDLPGKP